MAREKALQRADGTVMVILNQLGANLGQGQIALLGDQGLDTPCLRPGSGMRGALRHAVWRQEHTSARTSRTDTEPFSRLTA